MNRPVGVWLITVFCALNATVTVAGLYMLFSGRLVPMTGQQANYFAHLNVLDYALSILFHVCIVVGGVFLFMLRKPALPFFLAAAGLNLTQIIWQIFTHRFMAGAMEPRPMAWITLILAWAIILAIIFYTARLAKKGVLT